MVPWSPIVGKEYPIISKRWGLYNRLVLKLASAFSGRDFYAIPDLNSLSVDGGKFPI